MFPISLATSTTSLTHPQVSCYIMVSRRRERRHRAMPRTLIHLRIVVVYLFIFFLTCASSVFFLSFLPPPNYSFLSQPPNPRPSRIGTDFEAPATLLFVSDDQDLTKHNCSLYSFLLLLILRRDETRSSATGTDRTLEPRRLRQPGSLRRNTSESETIAVLSFFLFFFLFFTSLQPWSPIKEPS